MYIDAALSVPGVDIPREGKRADKGRELIEHK